MTEKEKQLIQIERNCAGATVIFDHTALDSKDVDQLVRGLPTNKQLETLSLLDCSLRGKDIIKLANAIQKNTTLTTVSIDRFKDDPADVVAAHELIEASVERNRQSSTEQIKPT